jgi:hypothetical protein
MPFPLPAGLAFFFEIALPGVLGGIVAYPLFPEWAQVGPEGKGLIGFISLCLFIGAFPRLFSYHVALFWMGFYWIPFHRLYAMRNLQADVVRAEAHLANSKTDMWTRWGASSFLESFLEANKKKFVISPTVLGNGFFVFVLDLYGHFNKGQAVSPNQLTVDDIKRLIIRAWFSLKPDVRSEIAEGLAVGSGIVNFSVIAAFLALAFIALGLLASPVDGLYVVRGLAVLIAARVAHLIGRRQVLSSMDIIRALLES